MTYYPPIYAGMLVPPVNEPDSTVPVTAANAVSFNQRVRNMWMHEMATRRTFAWPTPDAAPRQQIIARDTTYQLEMQDGTENPEMKLGWLMDVGLSVLACRAWIAVSPSAYAPTVLVRGRTRHLDGTNETTSTWSPLSLGAGAICDMKMWRGGFDGQAWYHAPAQISLTPNLPASRVVQFDLQVRSAIGGTEVIASVGTPTDAIGFSIDAAITRLVLTNERGGGVLA